MRCTFQLSLSLALQFERSFGPPTRFLGWSSQAPDGRDKTRPQLWQKSKTTTTTITTVFSCLGVLNRVWRNPLLSRPVASTLFALAFLRTGMPCFREEQSMDEYRSRLKLSENFERHWSILISGEIHMDQSLVHTFSWGNSYGLESSSKVPPYAGIGPWMALPSVFFHKD